MPAGICIKRRSISRLGFMTKHKACKIIEKIIDKIALLILLNIILK